MSILTRLVPTLRLGEQSTAQAVRRLDLPVALPFDGGELLLRELQLDDVDAVVAFVSGLPRHDVLFLRRDLADPDEARRWAEDALSGRQQTVLVFDSERLVGYLVVAASPASWMEHVAELRILLAPELRGHGLGRLLVAQAFAIARESGFNKLTAQMTADQTGARTAFERLGFRKEGQLRRHVADRDGRLHDLIVMGLDVEEFRDHVSAMIAVAAAGVQEASG